MRRRVLWGDVLRAISFPVLLFSQLQTLQQQPEVLRWWIAYIPLESSSIDKLIGQGLELLSLSGAELQQADVHLLHVGWQKKLCCIYFIICLPVFGFIWCQITVQQPHCETKEST